MSTESKSVGLADLRSAAPYGMAAFVAGLFANVFLVVTMAEDLPFDEHTLTWTFFGAHNVAIDVAGQVPSLGSSFNALTWTVAESGSLKLLWVVPPVLLAFFGRNFAQTRTGRSFGDDPVDGAKAGALVGAGYLLLAVPAAVFFAADGGTSPSLVETVVFMGVLYPGVFGGLGGYLTR